MSESPCTVHVNFGRLKNQQYSFRVEALADSVGDDGTLDLYISSNTKKHKPEPWVVVTNTVFIGSSTSVTGVSIRITYIVGKEVALFLYGVAGDVYVDPLIVDNIASLPIDGSQSMTGDINMGLHKLTNVNDPVSNKDAINKAWFKRYFERYIVVPSYKSFHKYNRKKLINVFLNDNSPDSDKLVGSDEIFTFTSGGYKSIEFCFGTLVNLTVITIASPRGSPAIDTEWELNYYNDRVTGSNWINMTINNYVKWTGQKIVATLSPRISTCFRLYFRNITTGTKMYSVDFTTANGVYDTN